MLHVVAAMKNVKGTEMWLDLMILEAFSNLVNSVTRRGQFQSKQKFGYIGFFLSFP